MGIGSKWGLWGFEWSVFFTSNKHDSLFGLPGDGFSVLALVLHRQQKPENRNPKMQKCRSSRSSSSEEIKINRHSYISKLLSIWNKSRYRFACTYLPYQKLTAPLSDKGYSKMEMLFNQHINFVGCQCNPVGFRGFWHVFHREEQWTWTCLAHVPVHAWGVGTLEMAKTLETTP